MRMSSQEEKAIETALYEVFEDQEENIFEGCSIETFEDAEILTTDKGLILYLSDGRRISLTIQAYK